MVSPNNASKQQMGFNSAFKGLNCLVTLKHVGEIIVNFNVNFNILKQFNYALVGRIKDFINL
jgi:hypothetical protein